MKRNTHERLSALDKLKKAQLGGNRMEQLRDEEEAPQEVEGSDDASIKDFIEDYESDDY